jgi:hypothetical protein
MRGADVFEVLEHSLRHGLWDLGHQGCATGMTGGGGEREREREGNEG